LPGLQEQKRHLDVLRDQVRRALMDAGLAAGQHTQLVPDLEQMAAEHPRDEQICGQLMMALYRSGRPADALTAYQRLRHILAEELGIEPGQPLREMQVAIRQQRVSWEALPAAASAPPLSEPPAPARLPPAPAQLPSAVPGFAGRAAELGRLDALLPQPGRAGLR
jgi:hypothetical protein